MGGRISMMCKIGHSNLKLLLVGKCGICKKGVNGGIYIHYNVSCSLEIQFGRSIKTMHNVKITHIASMKTLIEMQEEVWYL